MTNMQWLTYGFPLVAGLLAVAAYFYARHLAASFDRRFGPRPPRAGE